MVLHLLTSLVGLIVLYVQMNAQLVASFRINFIVMAVTMDIT